MQSNSTPSPAIDNAPQIAMEAVYHQFHDHLKHFIAQRINNPMAVEDILQDVFIKIHQGLPTLRDHRRLKSWLFRITRNTIIDYYRTHHRDVSAEMIPELPDLAESDTPAVEQFAGSLRAMIDALPPKYAEALVWVDLEGKSQAELAGHLNISISGAKSRVQRGRQLLRRALLECCHFEFDRRGTPIDYYPVECSNCRSENDRC